MKLPVLLALLVCLVTLTVVGCGPRAATPGPSPEAANLPAPPAPPAAAAPPGGLSGTLVVGVPCGLAMAYKEAKALFVQQNPDVKMVAHVKNVGPMMREVRDGKVKLDVFLSLGEEEIALLSKAGKVQGKPAPFLRQEMQLIVQKGNPLGLKRIEDLARPQVKTVAICVPERTLGKASEQALRAAGVWEALNKRDVVVRLDQPMQTKDFVFARKADAAFIYAACSTEGFNEADPKHAVGNKAEVVMTVPAETYGGMFAVAAVPGNAPHPDLAAKFIEFLLTAPAQEAMAKMGYGKVSAGATAP